MNTAQLAPIFAAPASDAQITPARWLALVAAGVTRIGPMHEAWQYAAFVYDRRYGLFPLAPAHVTRVLACLCAHHHGFEGPHDMLTHYPDSNICQLADMYVEFTDGVAYRYGPFNDTYTARWDSLTPAEHLVLSQVVYLDDAY